NLGSQYILEDAGEAQLSEKTRDTVTALLRQHFRPEFLNRIDETVFYTPLSKAQITGIVELMLESLRKRLDDRQLSIEVTEEAKSVIIDGGYDPVFGARPLKRYIQHHVETLCARLIIREDPTPGSTIVIDAENGELRASFK
ncbi:MAG: type VI secretion system ATPase TssH, partial [Clostridia bacterium]|nr:type VI secretion system ATPase TssH [Clostridia bacterium]